MIYWPCYDNIRLWIWIWIKCTRLLFSLNIFISGGLLLLCTCPNQLLPSKSTKFEDTLGGPLFVRRPRQLTLTRAGQVLIEHARVLLRDGQLAIDVSRSAMRGEAGLLRIGFGLPSLATGLPDLIQRFRIRFPRIQISMNEMSTPLQLDALGNRTLDVGFVRLPISASEISSFPLFTDRL